jgi:hypothetical protein
MKASVRVVIVALTLGLLLVLPFASSPVAAHEHVAVGEYELIVGWRNEPAVVGVLNGLDLGIEHRLQNGTTVWVVGVAGNLTAVLSTGPASVAKALEPQFGRDGWYTFDVIPTRVGTYSVRLNGTLGSTPINVNVDLDEVSPASDLEFPVTDPTASDLQALLNAANGQLVLALAFAFVGLAVAGIGIVLGWWLYRRQRKAP